MTVAQEFEDIIVNGALLTNDPVEQHLIRYMRRLQAQNKRLKEHIEKTGAWAHLKDVQGWKPFDFYHYFCTKYQERYGAEYRHTGNIVVTYQQIDQFRLGNNIEKADYKRFIDKAFSSHFNKINVPQVANLCSASLYNHIMGTEELSTELEYRNLDQSIISEAEKFEEYARKMAE
jgi:hypothetical protein